MKTCDDRFRKAEAIALGVSLPEAWQTLRYRQRDPEFIPDLALLERDWGLE